MRGLQTVLAAEADLEHGELDRALERAQQLLTEYPGHLAGRLIMGLAFCHKGQTVASREQFEIVLATDPENARARLGLARCYEDLGDPIQSARQSARAHVLGASDRDATLVYSNSRHGRQRGAQCDAKGDPLGQAIRLLRDRRYSEALKSFDHAIEAAPLLPEAWLGRLEALWQMSAPGAERAAAEILSNWPSCVKARLILADLRLQSGRIQEGSELLHQSQGLDPSGLVAQRVLGGRRQYGHLWAGAPSPQPETARRAAKEANSLTTELADSPRTSAIESAAPSRNPSLAEIKAELGRLVEFMSRDVPAAPVRSEIVRPAMLIVTNYASLAERFGEPAVAAVADRLTGLSSLLTTPEHAVHTLDLGSGVSAATLGATVPDRPTDFEAVKESLEEAVIGCLARGSEIRYLLLVGGNDILPFYRVPNPADDHDADIYTDAPYASRNGSLLIPTRAVGRIPDGASLETLLGALDSAIDAHRSDIAANRKEPRRTREKRMRADAGTPPSFGYTASVWRTSSRAVFDAIGEARQLRMSPPLTHQEFEVLVAARPRLAYFNLHGVEGEAPWYGQRDPEFAADYPLFPVALMPDAVTPACASGITVFSEACYGADILGRTARDSIAVKFLAAGARAFVGSTRLAYGALSLPLAGADLLGRFFWTALLNGMSAGQALQWAKLSFANDAMSRQGYLDAEDQKTLLTFNLLGEPTLSADAHSASWDAATTDAMVAKTAVVTSHAATCGERPAPVPLELVESVRAYVCKALPWLAPREVRATPQVICGGHCGGNCSKDTHATGQTRSPANAVITIAGEAGEPNEKQLSHVVKITVDRRGSIVKMSVSR